MAAVPDGKTLEDKYWLGFFREDHLTALLELVTSSPEDNTAYIGLFMMAAGRQGKGEGSRILEEVFAWLKSDGFTRVELDYTYGNQQSEAFWKKNGFKGNGDVRPMDGYTSIGMERAL